MVAVRGGALFDISRHAATTSDLADNAKAVAIVRDAQGERIGTAAEVLANTPEALRDPSKPWLLAPIDLQAVKAAGVTFAALHARARNRGAGEGRAGEGRRHPRDRAEAARRRPAST